MKERNASIDGRKTFGVSIVQAVVEIFVAMTIALISTNGLSPNPSIPRHL